MTTVQRKIAFISDDATVAAPFVEALRAMSGVEVKECNASLALLNGSAKKIAMDNPIVVFRTHRDAAQDIDALVALRRAVGKDTKLVALTEESTSLSEARRLSDAGADDVLPDTITPEGLVAQVERLSEASKAPAQMAPTGQRGKVIAVMPARGGIGATTVAVNLADRLINREGLLRKTTRNRVALLDLDLQFGAVASFLDVESRDALYRMATEGFLPDETFVEQSVSMLESGLAVLAAPTQIAPLDALRADQIAALIATLRSRYDYVVIDLPRTLVGWMDAVLDACDRMLLVTDSSVPTIRQARKLLSVFEEDHLQLPIEIVVNGEKKPMVPSKLHKEAAALLERPLKYWLPLDAKPARAAIDRGVPLADAASGAGLTKAIARMGGEILAAETAHTATQTH